MAEKTLTIDNKLGLHARAAAKFVQTASRYASEIKLAKANTEVNGKSIMGVMMLAAAKGTEVVISASGPDEDQAVTALTELINDKFGEAE